MWYNEWFSEWFATWFGVQDEEQEQAQTPIVQAPITLGAKRFADEQLLERRRRQIKKEDEDILAIIHTFVRCQ